MVVIYTNENNPAALKLVICLKYAGQQASVKNVETGDKTLPPPKRLPYVVLPGDRILFSSNAAAEYFFPCEQADEEFPKKWLEFEAFELAPVLALLLGSSAKAPAFKSKFTNTLAFLNNQLKEMPLNEKAVSVCDVSIWSTLYPLFADENLCKDYLSSFGNILKWMKKIGTELHIQSAVNEFKLKPGAVAYQALLTGSKYPANVPANVAENQSPTHSAPESVTAEELEAARKAWSNSVTDLPEPKKDIYPVLPVSGQKNILITSALPYVNNVPHLGNIIGCVLSADVFARFSRLCNWNTLYIGGTDEYGTATETKALEEGLTPQQICDKYFDVHNNIYRWFNIGFDYFGRTTTPEQTKLVQEMFLCLNHNGFMQTQPVEQLLCEKCNRYLADRFVEGGCPHPGCKYEDARGDQCDGCGKLVNANELKNPRCKMCKSSPVHRTSSQFFLDLPKLEPLLQHWMDKSLPGWTHNARVISKAWMKEGLKPRCITRDLKWGIPVPIDGYRDKVFYVWFDAPLGYISMTEKYTKHWKKWWQPAKDTEISLYQFMAKDNVPFHSVMFPAYLLGVNQGFTLVSHIMATEYLNYEDGKFSKSRGVGVFGTDAQKTNISSDVWRFYLLYVRPESQDSSFSWVDLATKNNSELLSNLGNFINRALVFTEKFYDSIVPKMKPTDEDYTLLALCARELKAYIACVEKGKLRDGIRSILSISRHGNQYMQSNQPWVLQKGSDTDKERSGTVIGLCCNITCLLATLMFPYMPETSRNLKKQINIPGRAHILTPDYPQIVNLLPAGHKIGKPVPLFSKIEATYVEEMKKTYGGSQQAPVKIEDAVKAETIEAAGDIALLEQQIENQGLLVRKLKSSGAAKAEWQPQVSILLGLKGKLAAAMVLPAPAKVAAKAETVEAVGDVSSLERQIENQGLLVRKLKASGAAKAEWQPQVSILLELKGKLAAAMGLPAPAVVGKKGKK